MFYNNQNKIPSINKHNNRFGGKENNHSLSPNIRPIHMSNKPIQNNFFPKNQLVFSNNNHYIIKINKITRKKEKIIEGDLNFQENSRPIYLKNIQKNNIQKKRGMPNKSPLPIPASFKPKDVLSFSRIFSSNPRLIHQKEQNKFNKSNKMFPSSGNTGFKNNYIFGGNINAYMNMSKSFYKKNERSHTPLLRTGDNKIMNLGMKDNKNRHASKSPNLEKNSLFNRNGNFSIGLLNNNNNVIKKIVKNMPNDNKKKKMNVNINPSQKRNTIISGEINQESLKINKINNNINKQGNVENINLKAISSNNNTLNLSSNVSSNFLHNSNSNINALKNNNKNDDILKNNFIKLNGSNSHNNIRKIARPKSPKNNPEKNKNHLNNKKKNIIINSNKINNDNAIKNINNIPNQKEKEKEEEIDINNKENNLKNEENNKKIPKDNIIENEQKMDNKPNNNNEQIEPPKINKKEKTEEIKSKNNERSLSQTPNDPLIKNKGKEYLINPEDKDTKKNKTNQGKKVIKKIREIYPYSHVGFDGEEPKENNQDNYFIFKNFAEHKDYIYMSVCDGHGVEGHFVSEFIKEVLPYYMSENLKDKDILNQKEITHQIITETFLIVNNMLVANENINSLFSGTTCVSVIFTPERLIVPNIGDSRAVLARFDRDSGKYKAIELSRDHKPTEKDEAKRIYENDGRIQPFTEDGEFVGPQRVWIKEEEVPGLAMTRSFGDRVAATVGVMSEPEIKEFDFNENDKYMIIASDGIWEFISSQECVDIIQKYYESNDLKGCCEYLYEESSKRWLKEEEVIDDTTLILVFFE